MSESSHATADAPDAGERIISLADLTVIELPPGDAVIAASGAGFTHVGLRLRPPDPAQHVEAAIGDTPHRREVTVPAAKRAADLLAARRALLAQAN